MNRANVLATCAFVAFAIAPNVSMAQQDRGAPSPAEKTAPSGAKAPGAVEHQNRETQNGPAGRNEKLDGRIGETPQNRGRPETTGQAPREEQLDQRNERTPEPKRGETEQGPRSERNGQVPATGQAPREERTNRATEQNRATQQAPQEERTNRASEQNRLEQERGRTDRDGNRATVGQGAAGTRATGNLTSEKRTQIHETIIHQRNAPRVNRVNFDISVGARVPRSVRFVALPQTIVEIEPAWRGFEYFMVGDEIVIVDPRSLEIVAVVDA
jgi:Protein of unknown function (DUF1236)